MILKDTDGTPGSDYINANRISAEDVLPAPSASPLGPGLRPPGAKDRASSPLMAAPPMSSAAATKEFIATQGCLPSTRADFWQMVWQENTRVIVMTTKEIERGKPKCARYWPDLDKSESFGKFHLRNVSETSNQDYTLREFMVSKEAPGGGKSEERKIFHFHFQVSPEPPVDPQRVLSDLFSGVARPRSAQRPRVRPQLPPRRQQAAGVAGARQAPGQPDRRPLLGRHWQDR